MSDIIFLSNVRLSFPHIAEPQRQVDAVTGKERISYNCELLMPADHAGFVQFMQQYADMALTKWVEHAGTVMNMIKADRKLRCFGVGEEKVNKKNFKPYDGYAGNVYVTTGRESQPQIIDAGGLPIDPNNSMAYQNLTRKMYGGCRVNAAIKPWLQVNKYGNGVRCDLVALQFAGDDTAFGEGATDASGMFGSVGGANPFAPVAAAMPGLPSFLA